MMNNSDRDLLLSFSDEPIGSSRRRICPKCGGGSTNEYSLVVTRLYEGLIFHCHRASCSHGGFIPTMANSVAISAKSKKKEAKPLKRPLQSLPKQLIEKLCSSYNLSQYDLMLNGVAHDYTANRYYFPIRNAAGYDIGAVAKCISKDNCNGPKAIIYFDNPDTPLTHFAARQSHHNTLIVVEDILSAIRVSRWGRGVALLGTNWNDATTVTLSRESDTVIPALDPDTWSMGNKEPLPLKIKKKYSLFFRNFKVVKLSKDPKDCPDDELNKSFA
jgi:hypothetical protein